MIKANFFVMVGDGCVENIEKMGGVVETRYLTGINAFMSSLCFLLIEKQVVQDFLSIENPV